MAFLDRPVFVLITVEATSLTLSFAFFFRSLRAVLPLSVRNKLTQCARCQATCEYDCNERIIRVFNNLIFHSPIPI